MNLAVGFLVFVLLLAHVLRNIWNKAVLAHIQVRASMEPKLLKKFDPWVRGKAELMGLTESVQFALGVCILVPVRFVLLLSTLVSGYIIVRVFRNRAIVTTTFRPLARVVLFAVGVLKVNEHGRKRDALMNPPAPLIIANHSNYVDAFYMVYAYAPSFVAKSSASKVPIIGALGRALHVIFAQRTEKEGLTKRIGERCDVWEQGKNGAVPLALFPEGTTTSGNSVIKFRTGAFVNKAPVQIVAITYSSSPSFNRAWGSESMALPLHLLRLMATPYTELTAIHLPVHHPSQAEKDDIALFSRNARSKLAAVLKLPSSEADFSDKVEFVNIVKKARKGKSFLADTKKDE